MRLLMEGEPVEHIDNALVKFGFPVGPIQLLDEVGIDTGTKIIPVLEAAWGDRFSPPANIISSILNDDRKGRKITGVSIFMRQKGVKAKNGPILRSTLYWVFPHRRRACPRSRWRNAA